ncbi:MAG: hypothetical protein Q4C00_00585 [Bacillota bacterium]|nr:hypothetical protein [Bacillota bacterium]
MLKELTNKLQQSLTVSFPGVEIYREFVRQDFQRPCFFPALKEVRSRREMGKRYLFTVVWEIKFFPKLPLGGDPRAIYRDLHEVAMKLYDILALPGYLAGAMSHEIKENVLVFALELSFYGEVREDAVDHNKMINMKLEME